jgi:2-polyprenyl-3-methyl-5-hydroxy-6-metoxy-1,4-benzoquinol methylase
MPSDPISADVIRYYESIESRLGYRLFLSGEKHLGWHPHGVAINDKVARRLTTYRVFEGLALTDPTSAVLLDAGCGLGGPSRQVAELGPAVSGISVVPFEVAASRAAAKKTNLNCRYQEMDYYHLRYAPSTFDGVYTIETLSHARNIAQVMAEFYRVLRPDKSVSFAEYTMAPDALFSASEKAASDLAISVGGLHAMETLRHGVFLNLLSEAGFENISVETHTTEVLPSLNRLHRWSHGPSKVFTRLGVEGLFGNTMVADSWASLFQKDLWRFITVTATKPA